MSNTSSLQGWFIGESLRHAWNIFQKKWTFLLMVGVVLLLSSALPSIVMNGMKDMLFPPFSFVLYVVVWVLQMVIGMGVIKINIALAREKDAALAMLLESWPLLLKYLAGMILYGLIVVGGMLLLIVPGIIFSIMFMYAPYLIIDRKMGPIEALKMSKKMTDGVKWDLIGFGFVTFVVTLLGLLALVVGLLVATPVVALAQATVYTKLLERIKKN